VLLYAENYCLSQQGKIIPRVSHILLNIHIKTQNTLLWDCPFSWIKISPAILLYIHSRVLRKNSWIAGLKLVKLFLLHLFFFYFLYSFFTSSALFFTSSALFLLPLLFFYFCNSCLLLLLIAKYVETLPELATSFSRVPGLDCIKIYLETLIYFSIVLLQVFLNIDFPRTCRLPSILLFFVIKNIKQP